MDSKTALTEIDPEETRCGSLTLAASTASAEVGSRKTAERLAGIYKLCMVKCN